ncbi:MAG TPA: hypothetical protein VMW16_01360 [Sedimentisphaerales bacterium]|nr:hypothetical protein [Sedimentisphaerales bacterium]
MNETEQENQETVAECESLRQYSRAEALINNLPYIAMTLLGAAIFVVAFNNSAWAWIAAAAYLLYGAAGALWIMVFVCPYCHFWNTAACPCGYGQISANLTEKSDGDRFNEKFRRHIPVIVPLWFIPALVGVIAVVRSFCWPLLALLAVFAIDAFIILPLVSRKHGCVDCPQKHSCPWMGRNDAGQ